MPPWMWADRCGLTSSGLAKSGSLSAGVAGNDVIGVLVPQNKAMKLTRLSAAPGRHAFDAVAEGAASCPRRHETAGTASQLIAGVLRT